jgi:Mrp family chromosome partitioning ATPase
MHKVMAMVAVMGMGQAASAAEDALAEAMARNPERFEARAIDLIAGFGGPDGLRADGIETHIALERAKARASGMRRFLAMDLDADGRVTRDEVSVSQHAASAASRGRMEREFTTADADGDAVVNPAEQAAAGAAAAFAAMGEEEAGVLRALLRLDANGDGALTAVEVSAAVARLDQAT